MALKPIAKTGKRTTSKASGLAPTPARHRHLAHTGCQHESHHHIDTGPALDQALDRLKSSGHKLTRPREILLRTLVTLEAPFSAEDVYRAAKKKRENANTDLVTVYRSLSTFSEIGILSKVELDDGIIRYELSDPEGRHHHHVVCTSCRRIEPLDLCSVEGQIQGQEQRLAQLGYTALVHRLEFYGLCPACTKVSAP